MDEVASVKSDTQSRNAPRDVKSNYEAHCVPGTLTHIQAKEADIEAIAELTYALDKKEALVFELRRMNDDVLENQRNGEIALKDSDAFKKQYAAVVVQLDEANVQARASFFQLELDVWVSSALFRLRQRNTYQQNFLLKWPRVVGEPNDHGVISSSKDHTANHTKESERHVNEIVEISRTKARSMVSSALFRLRQRNTYQQNFLLKWPRVVGEPNDHGVISSSKDHTANHTKESERHVNEIVEISRTKARSMVDMAIQALSSLRLNPTVDIEKAVDYVSEKIPSNDSYIPPAQSNPIASNPVHAGLSLHKLLVSTVKAPVLKPISPLDTNKSLVPSELITQCVATLFVIQKCTERQVPPAEVASILDSAVSSLQPCSPRNLQVYADIQKCMKIIKNQILALVPT
ncbi:protein ALWAYS EARLY 3 isoform X2 [Tanacetum coccineum]